MKKIFTLTDPKKHADRVLEAVKHDIRKYVKREKRKELAEPESTYWDFDCRIGVTAEEAKSIAYKELLKALEDIQAAGAAQVYVEILVKAVPKPVKLIEEVLSTEVPAEESPAQDEVIQEAAMTEETALTRIST